MLQLRLTVASQGPLSKRVKAWFAGRMPGIRTVCKPWRGATHPFEPTVRTVAVGLSEGWVTESFPRLSAQFIRVCSYVKTYGEYCLSNDILIFFPIAFVVTRAIGGKHGRMSEMHASARGQGWQGPG